VATTTFETVFASVRPPRVATFLDRNDPDWQHTCLRIIEFYSSVWGGKYNIIVPTDGTVLLPDFWKVLELYDPDYSFSYVKTYRDLKITDPAKYEEVFRRYTERTASQLPDTDWEQLKGDLDQQLQAEESSNFGISSELAATLKRRLAVFHHENHTIQSRISAGSSAVYQLTQVAKILAHCDHADKIAVTESLPTGLSPLWLAAVAGSCSNTLNQELALAGLKEIRVGFPNERLHDVIRLGVKGHYDVEHQRALRVIRGEESEGIEDITPCLPFQISMTQVALYRSARAEYWKEPAVVVLGETIDDFAFYFCLSRLRPKVAWLPPSWIKKHESGLARVHGTEEKLTPEESFMFYFGLALRDLAGHGRDNMMSFVSLSLGQEEIQNATEALAKAQVFDGDEFRGRCEIRSPADVLPPHPYIAFEVENVAKPMALQFVDGDLPGWFETPKPRKFRKIEPAEFRWIVEISIKGHAVPRHPALGAHVIRDSRLGSVGVRAGRNGIAYYCPNMMVIYGLDVDTLLVKPKVSLPNALDIFQCVAAPAGYRCAPSQKGVFTQETTRKFGGLSALAEFLRNARRRALLDKFLDTKRPAEGEHDEGVLLASDRRRYLDFASIQKVVGTNQDAQSLIDELVVKGVLHRGFIFKCRLCRNADWFSVGEISHQFKCKRCGLLQTYTREHSLRNGEPAWFYKLDELVLRAHQNGFAVPTLALNYLRRQNEDNFLFAPELEVFGEDPTKPFIEMDICCIPGGVLTIGEAKKGNTLGGSPTEVSRTVGKYRSIAEKFCVGQVVFATAEKSWSTETIKKIQEAFSNLPIAITLISRAELLSQ
jgi:hypothetical protein